MPSLCSSVMMSRIASALSGEFAWFSGWSADGLLEGAGAADTAACGCVVPLSVVFFDSGLPQPERIKAARIAIANEPAFIMVSPTVHHALVPPEKRERIIVKTGMVCKAEMAAPLEGGLSRVHGVATG